MNDEMVVLTENVGGNLKWSSMADNASFGLEYYLLGREDQTTDDLLQEGVKFCHLLVTDDSDLKTSPNINGLEAYLMKSTLSNSIEKSSDKTPDDIIEAAKNVKESLLQVINKKKKLSEDETRKMQNFFNEASVPYLKEAFQNIRKIEVTRRKSSNVRT